MTQLQSNTVNHVSYTRTTTTKSGKTGDKSERFVIPTRIPKDTVTVIDVSALTEDDRSVLVNALSEYQAYHKERMNAIMKFEDWYEHTQGIRPTTLHWRTLKESSVEVLD